MEFHKSRCLLGIIAAGRDLYLHSLTNKIQSTVKLAARRV